MAGGAFRAAAPGDKSGDWKFTTMPGLEISEVHRSMMPAAGPLAIDLDVHASPDQLADGADLGRPG
jgi:hypothetical protein